MLYFMDMGIINLLLKASLKRWVLSLDLKNAQFQWGE